jgi:hypothetical protein
MRDEAAIDPDLGQGDGENVRPDLFNVAGDTNGTESSIQLSSSAAAAQEWGAGKPAEHRLDRLAAWPPL